MKQKLFLHLVNLIKLFLKLLKKPTLVNFFNNNLENFTFDIIDFLNENGPKYTNRIGNNPFNNQKLRTNLIDDILIEFKPDLLVETGTFMGDTTLYLSKSGPTISIEKSKLYYTIAKARFLENSEITLVNNDSSKGLNEINDFSKKTFFYLDAHWGSDLPLKKELDYITNNFKIFVICIDDFKIPNNSSWGYDTYENIELNIDLISNKEVLNIYYPDYDSSIETGEKRGSIFITSRNLNFHSFKKNNFKKFL